MHIQPYARNPDISQEKLLGVSINAQLGVELTHEGYPLIFCDQYGFGMRVDDYVDFISRWCVMSQMILDLVNYDSFYSNHQDIYDMSL